MKDQIAENLIAGQVIKIPRQDNKKRIGIHKMTDG